MSLRAFVLASTCLVSTLAILACSGGGDGGNPGSDDAGAGNEGGGGDAGGGGDTGSSTPNKGGGVYLTSYDYTVASTPVVGMTASAAFSGTYSTAPGPCTVAPAGDACTITQCTAGSGGDAGAPVAVSAGAITITGGTTPVNLTPNGSGYDAVNGKTTLWNGGEELHAVAAGADVPAFDVKLTAPSYVTITAPVFPSQGGSVAIVRSQGLNVAWTGGAAGDVRVTVYGGSAQQTVTVTCNFPAAGGSGTLSASLLGNLPAGGTTNGITMQVVSETNTVVSNWGVRFFAETLAKTSSGIASGNATIQ